MFENKDKLPFKDLTKEQRSLIVEAWVKGFLEIYLGFDTWGNVMAEDSVVLELHAIYRIPKKKLEIPWDMIDKRWQWVAMDSYKNVFFYTDEPSPTGIGWRPSHPCGFCPNALAISTVGVNWESSLQRRP